MAKDIYSLYSDIFLEKYTNYDHYEILVIPEIDMSSATKFIITPKYEYRPDLISYDKYGTLSFEELIGIANKFTDPIKDYYAGRTIKIPSFDVMAKLMGLSV